METRQMAQQFIDLQRTMFDSSFAAIAAIQDLTQQTMTEQANKLPWVTEDGKKNMNEMCDFNKQCRDSFKKSVDEGYARIEELMQIKDSTVTN